MPLTRTEQNVRLAPSSDMKKLRCAYSPPPPPPQNQNKKQQKNRKKNNTRNNYYFSTYSLL